MKEIAIGTTGTAETDVTFGLTAASIDSALPEVHSTPMLVGLIEKAGRNAIEPLLDEGMGTVGAAVDIQHIAGSPIGYHVTAKATVKSVNGRIVVFDVEAYDDEETVCRGTHTRAIINREKHAAKLAEKKARKANK